MISQTAPCFAILLATTVVASAQDAAPADRNAVHSKATPGDMMADSPVTFPKSGALPSKFPPDTRAEAFDPGEKGYYLFSSPPRSLKQIKTIQAEMPAGRFTPPANDWKHLPRTRHLLTEGGALHIVAIGDSIVNDTMRSGWIALLREAYPNAEISATVYVRGGGGCQHFIEEDRLARHVIPRKPDLVFLGGISQKGTEQISKAIDMLRAGHPETEFLLASGAFGTTDPRHPAKLAAARHSGTGAYGKALRVLAGEKRCAFLDFTAPWADYINSSGQHPHRFYRDVVHANAFGEQILGKILMAFWKGNDGKAKAGAGLKRLLIDQVPAGFPVRFCLLTAGDRQHAAYYNAEHQMTVASRQIDSDDWTYTHLPSKIGWDSHNYLTMVLDDDGHLHLSGNMHCVPLIYFRTTRPGDASSLVRIKTMVGPEEERCTYPHFMRGPQNELIFHYRTGGSGRGNEIYNVYDHETKTWSRLLDKPLTDGRGRMNAYMHGPVKGPDGFYHLAWVWRNTPDCATNHDLSYARSPDLRSWETADGQPVQLPLTLDDKRLVVDPVQPGGGIINGCGKIGFDADKQVVITYHKFDAKGLTQAFAARFDGDKWLSRQISDWNYRWQFGGGGSIDFEIGLGSPTDIGHGRMMLGFSHKTLGRGKILFDADTLLPLPPNDPRRELPHPPKKPSPRVAPELSNPTSDFPGLGVQWAGDSGKPTDPGVVYRLRWEALSRNRDRPRTGKLPEPSKLELIELR